jgi:polysaccharide biosynthesis transport protein
MDLRDFYRLILRNLALTVVSVLLGVGVAAGITYSMTPIYQAKVQLFVSTPSSALDVAALVQGSSFSQQRVKSYAQIVNGPETLRPVIVSLNLPYSYEQLAKNVTASAPLDTVLISVTVSDPNAYLAARIANAVGQQFAVTANSLEISRSTDSSAIKVSMVKSASLPKSPSSPKTALNLLLGLILGFGLGVGLSILRTIFDNTLKNESDLDETALLASIAFDPSAEEKPLITQISRYAPRTESFRAFRTNLQYVRAENPPKVIAITSAVPGEGKTSTSLNLAISFATSGMKTLLIEADMRRPKIREYTSTEGKQSGLSDILSGKIQGDIATRVQEAAYSFPDHELTVISSGTTPPNPAELLDSETFKQVIEYAKAQFDFVIVDCPPTLLVADAAIIAARTDGAVIVTRVAKTKVNQFLGARENLTNVGVTILGAVMNMIPYSRTDEYGRKYGYGYGYGYGKYRSYRSYRAYRSYGAYGNEAGYHPKASYAPKDFVPEIESDNKK